MTPWILLRGLTRDARHWHDFPARLQRDTGKPVYAIDMPGNGKLHQLDSPTRVETMVEHARVQLTAAGIEPPYRVMAMSLGAMVTVAWAHAYPQELKGAVLINTSLRPFSPFTQRLLPRNYVNLLRMACFQSPREREETVLRMTTRPAPGGAAPEALVDMWTEWQREFPVSCRNAMRQLVAAARYRAPRKRPRTPLLVLTSRGDTLVHTRCSDQVARVWKCPLARHPAAGHDLPLDDPKWVVRQVQEWLGIAPATEKSRPMPL